MATAASKHEHAEVRFLILLFVKHIQKLHDTAKAV